MLCNLVCQNHSSSEIFIHKVTAVCIDLLIGDSSANGLLSLFAGKVCAKQFGIEYQVLDCTIVQQNMVTLCNGTQNYNLQHKNTSLKKTSLSLVN